MGFPVVSAAASPRSHAPRTRPRLRLSSPGSKNELLIHQPYQYLSSVLAMASLALYSSHLVLHPQLTRALKVLSTTVGRDKVSSIFPPLLSTLPGIPSSSALARLCALSSATRASYALGPPGTLRMTMLSHCRAQPLHTRSPESRLQPRPPPRLSSSSRPPPLSPPFPCLSLQTYRLIQYFARLLAWHYLRTSDSVYKTNHADKWTALKAGLATLRKGLRIGKPLEHLQTAVKLSAQMPRSISAGGGAAEMERVLQVARQMAYACVPRLLLSLIHPLEPQIHC